MVKKGEFSKIQDYAAKIEMIIQGGNYTILHRDFYNLLIAELHAAQGKEQAAMDSPGKTTVISEAYSPRYRILEAASLELIGAPEKAIKCYLNFYNAVTTRYTMNMGDWFYFYLERSKVDYRIAQTYDKEGNTDKAIEHYEKFLYFEKNADSYLPEVENARKRLVELKAQ